MLSEVIQFLVCILCVHVHVQKNVFYIFFAIVIFSGLPFLYFLSDS